jgi:hypothetical protein
MRSLSDITVAALEIASVCNLEFKITERRDRGGIRSHLSLERCLGEGDQIFRKAKLDEFFVLLSDRRVLTPADLEEKLIGIRIEFVKFIFYDIVEVGFFEVF